MAVSTHVREHAYHFQFNGSRDAIKHRAALQAIDILCKDIKAI